MRWAKLAPTPQRYSYGVVLAAVAVELLAPRWAGWVLGPVLLLGLVLLGVAHGACDQHRRTWLHALPSAEPDGS